MTQLFQNLIKNAILKIKSKDMKFRNNIIQAFLILFKLFIKVTKKFKNFINKKNNMYNKR